MDSRLLSLIVVFAPLSLFSFGGAFALDWARNRRWTAIAILLLSAAVLAASVAL